MCCYKEVGKAQGTEVAVERLTDIRGVARCGVMAMPGVVIDGQAVYVGGVPTPAVVEPWLFA